MSKDIDILHTALFMIFLDVVAIVIYYHILKFGLEELSILAIVVAVMILVIFLIFNVHLYDRMKRISQ